MLVGNVPIVHHTMHHTASHYNASHCITQKWGILPCSAKQGTIQSIRWWGVQQSTNDEIFSKKMSNFETWKSVIKNAGSTKKGNPRWKRFSQNKSVLTKKLSVFSGSSCSPLKNLQWPDHDPRLLLSRLAMSLAVLDPFFLFKRTQQKLSFTTIVLDFFRFFFKNPRRFAICVLVPKWYKTFPPDHIDQEEINKSTMLSHTQSTLLWCTAEFKSRAYLWRAMNKHTFRNLPVNVAPSKGTERMDWVGRPYINSFIINWFSSGFEDPIYCAMGFLGVKKRPGIPV